MLAPRPRAIAERIGPRELDTMLVRGSMGGGLRCRDWGVAGAEDVDMVTTGQLIHQVATLYAAIDRLRSFLPDEGHEPSPNAREFLEMAAHDVVRAWTQVCRRLRQVEHETTHAAAAALDRAARTLGMAFPTLVDPGSPKPVELSPLPQSTRAGDTSGFRRLDTPGGAGDDR